MEWFMSTNKSNKHQQEKELIQIQEGVKEKKPFHQGMVPYMYRNIIQDCWNFYIFFDILKLIIKS